MATHTEPLRFGTCFRVEDESGRPWTAITRVNIVAEDGYRRLRKQTITPLVVVKYVHGETMAHYRPK